MRTRLRELLVAVLHNAEAPDKSRLVGAAGIAPSYGPRRGSSLFVHVTPPSAGAASAAR